MPDSLLAHGDRRFSTLLPKHTQYHKLLPGCSFAFKSLITECLHLYSMLAQHKVQLQLRNQRWAHPVQSTVLSAKSQAEVFRMTGNLLSFGANLSELVKNPAVVQRQGIVSHLTAIRFSA